MAVDNIVINWESGFQGKLISPTGQILVGDQLGGLQPYHMLFGSLASCFYATFLSIADKKRLTFDKATVEVSGSKRIGEIATLEHVKITLSIHHPSDKVQLEKSAVLGAKFCSVYNTISQVANMELEVLFK